MSQVETQCLFQSIWTSAVILNSRRKQDSWPSHLPATQHRVHLCSLPPRCPIMVRDMAKISLFRFLIELSSFQKIDGYSWILTFSTLRSLFCNFGIRGPFLESPGTVRAHFGWHDSLCVCETKEPRGTKLCSYFNCYSLYNISKDQIYRISESEV